MILTLLKRKCSDGPLTSQKIFQLQIEKDTLVEREQVYQQRIAELERQVAELRWHLNPAEEVQP